MDKKDKENEWPQSVLAHPGLKERFEAILDIVNNTSGELITADHAEGELIKETKKLGQEVLTSWATTQHDKAVEIAKKTHPTAKRHEKKSFIGKAHLEG